MPSNHHELNIGYLAFARTFVSPGTRSGLTFAAPRIHSRGAPRLRAQHDATLGHIAVVLRRRPRPHRVGDAIELLGDLFHHVASHSLVVARLEDGHKLVQQSSRASKLGTHGAGLGARVGVMIRVFPALNH